MICFAMFYRKARKGSTKFARVLFNCIHLKTFHSPFPPKLSTQYQNPPEGGRGGFGSKKRGYHLAASPLFIPKSLFIYLYN